MGQACSACSEDGKKTKRKRSGQDTQKLLTDDEVEDSFESSKSENSLMLVTEWCKAVQADNSNKCKTLLSQNPRLHLQDVMIDRERGERAVHIAVRNRNTMLIELLGFHRADMSCRSRVAQNTPLHIAAKMNDVTIIRLLLYFGADASSANNEGRVPQDLVRDDFKNEFTATQIEQLRMEPNPPSWSGNKKDFWMSTKREEIKARGNIFITKFGRNVGCEADEIGLCCQRLDAKKKSQVWKKVVKKNSVTDKQADINKILVVLTAATLKMRKSSNKPDVTELLKLNNFLLEKLPLLDDGRRALRETDFYGKMHFWLMDIHNSPEWQMLDDIDHGEP